MEQGILHLHNFSRWLVIIFGIWALLKGMSGMGGGKVFTKSSQRPALFFMIVCDIQLLLGISLYVMKGWFNALTSGGNVMGNQAVRFWSFEHGLGMIIAIIFAHVAYSATKKNISDGSKFSRMFWLTLIALLIIFVTIPWPFREVIGRPLFPGMSVSA